METEQLAQFIQDEYFAALPELPNGFALSLLNAAFERVNWVQIAQYLKELARVAQLARATAS